MRLDQLIKRQKTALGARTESGRPLTTDDLVELAARHTPSLSRTSWDHWLKPTVLPNIPRPQVIATMASVLEVTEAEVRAAALESAGHSVRVDEIAVADLPAPVKVITVMLRPEPPEVQEMAREFVETALRHAHGLRNQQPKAQGD